MTDHPDSPVVVTGAGGRAGRAVVAEAIRRGVRVVAVVRDPARAADLHRDGVRVVAGNALVPARLTPAALHLRPASPPRAWVTAITPFSTPPDDFEGFDSSFYRRAHRAALEAARRTGTGRLVVVGLFATLTHRGRPVLDDPSLFPPRLRPFARAHAAGLETLRDEAGDIDWLTLAPPPLLSDSAPVTGAYRLGDGTLDPRAGSALSYTDLAVAVLDEIEKPTRHREQVAIYPADQDRAQDLP
ncbi:NAD(P)-dependent oxidoreductase [Kineosporia succinea]|uniref:NADH-flavin reductase n=1 Tax=Kineosporia succinea TaxID=84632 RepID=A0ABT9P8R2_9ACTN|nr:NAD(P)H-binding protein [Kineosporia succinea]MDP9829090.1 putative NADH-flavin reductase [Kineosporia succinea]